MSEKIVLTAEEQRFYLSLREHAHAPNFNYQSTDMLTPSRLGEVKDFAQQVQTQRFWPPGGHPDWLAEFTQTAFRSVPYYRALGRPPRVFEAIPSFGRQRFSEQPWSFVPDQLSLEALTVYTTSGTSASAMVIPTHPNVSSMLLVLLESLLEKKGVSLPRGPGQVAIALVAWQQDTLTYPSVSHYLGGAGFLKLNLADHVWRDPADRTTFLLDTAPAVITGSPFAFEKLAQLVPELRPKALVSSAVAHFPGQAARLEDAFGCPVFDLYSMTEARGIAGRVPSESGLFELLCHDLYVEILGPNDEVLEPGQVGEIVVTGGRNPYFPLLRYRTGDRAALVHRCGTPCLENFEGRQAVHLETQGGQTVPTLDVIHALKALPLVGFSLVQKADRSISVTYCGRCALADVQEPLEALFEVRAGVTSSDSWQGKPHQFRSEM